MIKTLWATLTKEERRNQVWLAAGAASLMTGGKVTPMALFFVGMRGLEGEWRRAHPEFRGGLEERIQLALEHYEATRQHPTHRLLESIGTPMALAGGAGLLATPRFSAPWWLANGSWTLGWALSLAGHRRFGAAEHGFASDPVALLVGPCRELARRLAHLSMEATGEEPPPPTVETSRASTRA